MPHFDADLGQLARIRNFVTETAATLGVRAAAFDDLRLAVDEAVTNILVHGYGGVGGIDIDITARNGDLVIRLLDQATPFDPAIAAPETMAPPETHTEAGGFGLYLMSKAMDEIEYRRLDSQNELTLVKCNVIEGN